MRILHRSLIALIALITLPSIANAEWKKIPCDEIKFKASIPFQSCHYELSTSQREIWTGAFHDEHSSAFIATYTHPNGMKLEDGASYATSAAAYRVFFDKYPNPSQLSPAGQWLSFPARVFTAVSRVKTQTTSRDMNCLQFFKTSKQNAQFRYFWTAIAAMCVTSGTVPVTAADLVLESLQVDIK